MEVPKTCSLLDPGAGVTDSCETPAVGAVGAVGRTGPLLKEQVLLSTQPSTLTMALDHSFIQT